MRVKRGGHTLKTGKIGYANILRQQVLMPGERMNIRMKGTVRLESLRERDALRINAHLASFMTPWRWVWPNYNLWVKEGPETTTPIPFSGGEEDYSRWGVGSAGGVGFSTSIPTYFSDVALKCYNEWYKWPESLDAQFADMTEWGLPACPLAKTWSRMRFSTDPVDSVNYDVPSATSFDVRDLSEIQGKFKSAMKRDVLSFGRWMELLQEMWKADGSREVDQVPIMLDQVEIGVNPREMPATDGASLGQWQSLFDFEIDHRIPGVIAPEHCTITHILTIRFPATLEGRHPHTLTSFPYEALVGDPEYLAMAKPVDVTKQQLFMDNSVTVLGKLPAGWIWACDSDVVGKAIDERDSFPYSLIPNSQAECKDATRVKSAFRSQGLDDYVADIYFTEEGYQPIGDAMDSYFSGMADDLQVSTSGRGREFPKGGKNL